MSTHNRVSALLKSVREAIDHQEISRETAWNFGEIGKHITLSSFQRILNPDYDGNINGELALCLTEWLKTNAPNIKTKK